MSRTAKITLSVLVAGGALVSLLWATVSSGAESWPVPVPESVIVPAPRSTEPVSSAISDAARTFGIKVAASSA